MVAICVVATIAHRSGVYVGSWGSNLAGGGTFGGENMELDLIAGYRTKLTDTGILDVGLIRYMYPGGAASVIANELGVGYRLRGDGAI